jgi:hypothetical protein
MIIPIILLAPILHIWLLSQWVSLIEIAVELVNTTLIHYKKINQNSET